MPREPGYLLTYWVDQHGKPSLDGFRHAKRLAWLEPDRDIEAHMKATAWGGTLRRLTHDGWLAMHKAKQLSPK